MVQQDAGKTAQAAAAENLAQGAAQPSLPGDAEHEHAADAALTGSGAMQGGENDQRGPASGSPTHAPGADGGEIPDEFIGNTAGILDVADGTDEDDDEDEDAPAEQPEPTPVNHGVVQDNVTEPGVQRTITPDGETTHDEAAAAADDAEAAASRNDTDPDDAEAEPDSTEE